MTIAGNLLRLARAKSDLTVEELADRAGVAAESISDIEAGTRQPTLEEVEELVAAAGWSLRFVIREPDQQSALTEERDRSRTAEEQDAWAAEQAVWVRQQAEIDAALEGLDMLEVLAAEGRDAAVMDDDGSIVVHHPDGTSTVMNALVADALAALLGSGTAVSVEQIAQARDTSTHDVHRWVSRRRREGALVTATHEDVVWVPTFQLTDTFDTQPEAAAIIRRLRQHGMSGWAVWDWAETPNVWLDGKTPAEVLTAGNLDAVHHAIDGLFQL